eukprot:TRINITY_DN4192_c0_g1_i6.p1 TRINITY_DN4192_c0_g1~~TRINITY_DN4192_c0_g1_i6.p1  ORF type:complete len:465 (-),score=107.51 TRINITY_DN4192_c0_g1_i6:166-1560(-)
MRGPSGQVRLQPLQLRPLQLPREQKTTLTVPDALLVVGLLWVIAYRSVVGAAATALASVLLRAALFVPCLLCEIACWLAVGAVAAGLAIALVEAVWAIATVYRFHWRAMLHAEPRIQPLLLPPQQPQQQPPATAAEVRCVRPLLQQDELVLHHPRQLRATGPLTTEPVATHTTHYEVPEPMRRQQQSSFVCCVRPLRQLPHEVVVPRHTRVRREPPMELAATYTTTQVPPPMQLQVPPSLQPQPQQWPAVQTSPCVAPAAPSVVPVPLPQPPAACFPSVQEQPLTVTSPPAAAVAPLWPQQLPVPSISSAATAGPPIPVFSSPTAAFAVAQPQPQAFAQPQPSVYSPFAAAPAMAPLIPVFSAPPMVPTPAAFTVAQPQPQAFTQNYVSSSYVAAPAVAPLNPVLYAPPTPAAVTAPAPALAAPAAEHTGFVLPPPVVAPWGGPIVKKKKTNSAKAFMARFNPS